MIKKKISSQQIIKIKFKFNNGKYLELVQVEVEELYITYLLFFAL